MSNEYPDYTLVRLIMESLMLITDHSLLITDYSGSFVF